MKQFLLNLLCLFCCVNLYAQPPANDDCANATPIAVDDVLAFSTLNSTTDGLKHLDCFGTNDSIPNDIWFTWTAPKTTGYSFSNCGTADYDSRMAVYANAAACPPTDAELFACNDDGDVTCTSSTSVLNFLATEGTNYTFRVGGFSDNPDSLSTMGSGTVTLIELFGPANDFCSGAIVVELGTEQAFTTVSAITDGPDHPTNSACFGFNFSTMASDIWYAYTAGFTGSVQWNTCDMIGFDSRLAIYQPGSACPPQDADLYSCNDDSGCNDLFHSTVIFDVMMGETYILRLGGFSGESGSGTFDLIEIVPPEPPANDECANADEVFVISQELANNPTSEHGIFFGTTIAGSTEADFEFPPCLANMNGGEFSDVWYHFNSLSNDSLEIRFTPVTPTSVFLVDFYTACGTQIDTLILGTCFTNEADVQILDTVFTLPAADTDLFMRVTTRLTTELPGDFIFQIIGKNFIPSGTRDLAEISFLQVNPNPVNDITYVEFNLVDSKLLSLSVVNNVGQVVYQENVKKYLTGRHVEQIDMGSLPAGVYFISLNDGQNTKVQKVVKY